MTKNEFGKQCQRCRKRGDEKFARMYYEKIDDKFKRICSVCWNDLENAKKKMKQIERKFGGKKKYRRFTESLLDTAVKSGNYHTRAALLEIVGDIKPKRKKST